MSGGAPAQQSDLLNAGVGGAGGGAGLGGLGDIFGLAQAQSYIPPQEVSVAIVLFGLN